MARKLIVLLFATITVYAMCGPRQTAAQDWPQRPVRIIGPYAAGGNADVLARLTAQQLSDAFRQQFVVENRVGGNGVIAAEAVARSAPDGYTLMWGVLPPIAIQPAMTKVPYDPIKDFAPISVVGDQSVRAGGEQGRSGNKREGVHRLGEIAAEQNAYAEGAAGSVTHLAMALFLKRAGIEMTNVSYRGNAPAMTDVIAGHLPTMFSNVSDALPQIKAAQSGRWPCRATHACRNCRTCRPSRSPAFPDIACITWNGLMAPAGTPKPIVDKIAAEIAKALQGSEIRRDSLRASAPIRSATRRSEFAALIAEDLENLGGSRRSRRLEGNIRPKQ